MKKILLVLLVGLLVSCSCEVNDDDTNTFEFEIGKEYLFSMYWDEPNPFFDKNIDTVIILDIKDGYFKWVKKRYSSFSGGFTHSDKIDGWIKYYREIPTDDTTEELDVVPDNEYTDDEY